MPVRCDTAAPGPEAHDAARPPDDGDRRTITTAAPSPMRRYEVGDVSADGQRVLLVDASGQPHVARWRGAAPARGDRLLGRQAKLGAHVLLAGAGGTPMRVDFEALNCTQDQALALMHPMPPAA